MKKVALLCLFSVSSIFAITPSVHDYLIVREHSPSQKANYGPPPGKNKAAAIPPAINEPQPAPPGRGKVAGGDAASHFKQGPPPGR